MPPGRARAPLPTTATDLPPVELAWTAALDEALAALDLTLEPGPRRAIEDQVRLLSAWNAAINLTAIRDPASVAVQHVADSLAALPLLRNLMRDTALGDPEANDALTLLDVGSGGGYPGLPLGVTLPAARLGLVESVGKKARFLAAVAGVAAAALAAAGDDVAAPAIDVLPVRAEALGSDPANRAAWSIVTVRAVAPMARLAELCLPLVAVGGWLVAWKRDSGGALEAELAAAAPRIRAFGGAPPRVERSVPPDRLPALADHRLVLVRRIADVAPRPPSASRATRRGKSHRLP
jgi:16S rRNA (guanine527-N7)-methyltransferase